MQVLDSSIANVSIPTIAGDLGVSSDQGTWVITSFAVSNGVSVPLTGWLMQRFGVVRTFVRLGAGLHHRLVAVRHVLEPAVADRVPRAAGRGLRAR
jgi:MFS family permease